MKVLGIETSCDETAVCLIDAHGIFDETFGFKILGNALISQAALHAKFGGVFPNLAKREHAKNLVPLLIQALTEAEMLKKAASQSAEALLPLTEMLSREPDLLQALTEFLLRYEKPDIDCIAVTHGPGLEPALWVGVNFARALAAIWNIPIVAVNHMEGHVILPMMTSDTQSSGRLAKFEFPVLALLISGGHSELLINKSFGEYELLGETRDDAAGEAFDKVARLLGLGYPGGPEISRLAAEARKEGLDADFKLPRPMLSEDNFDFSFSGLKTAVRRLVDGKELSDDDKKKIAREFEDAVAEVLVEKTIRAGDEYGAETIVVGGGVSANDYIRERLANRIASEMSATTLLVPSPELATDNALMIALCGYFHAIKKEFTDSSSLVARGNLKLGAT